MSLNSNRVDVYILSQQNHHQYYLMNEHLLIQTLLELVLIFIVIKRNTNKFVFLCFTLRFKFQKFLFPFIIFFQMFTFRLNNQLISQQVTIFLSQKKYKIWFKCLPVSKAEYFEMSFITNEIYSIIFFFLIPKSSMLASGMDPIKFFHYIDAQKRGNVIPRPLGRGDFIHLNRIAEHI